MYAHFPGVRDASMFAQQASSQNATVSSPFVNDYPVLYAKPADGLSFTNNTITRSHRFTPFHPNKYMFTLLACKKITIAGNTLVGDVPGRNIQLQNMAAKELSAKVGEGLSIQQ